MQRKFKNEWPTKEDIAINNLLHILVQDVNPKFRSPKVCIMTTTKKPKLLVFDLDYTLWPFWVDTHVTPPFTKKNGTVVDRHGQKVKYYKEVPEVLESLKKEGYLIGVASRTSEVRGAESLINLFGWSLYFDCKQIYPGCKLRHFEVLKRETGVEYHEMIFFDDEHRNIRDLQSVGVLSILVKDGVNIKVIQAAVEEFAKRNK